MGASSWVHLDVKKIVKITAKAMLVRLAVDDDHDQDVWLPLSQVDEPDNYTEGDEDITVSVTEWIAEQKGLER